MIRESEGELSSVPDPLHFRSDPGPRIRNSDKRIRMRPRIRTKIFSDFKDAKK
jgi:hypothetical protein